MTPSARLAAAIELLAGIEDAMARRGPAADRVVERFFKQRRYAGAGDRRWIKEAVYRTLRRRGELAERLRRSGAPADARHLLLLAEWMTRGPLPAEWFDGPHAVPAPDDESRARLEAAAALAPEALPKAARHDLPELMLPGLARRFGAALGDETAALAERAPVDLRVLARRRERDAVLAELRDGGLDAAPTPISPDGVRLSTTVGADRLDAVRRTRAILQDEASQIAARFVLPAEGRQVAELGAGGGGKTLALADLMKGTGQIYAFDSDARRLEETRRRAREAKVTNLQCHRLPRFGDKRLAVLGRFAGMMDRVLVDAPCSGSGTWRRHPDAKWRLDADRLAELVEIQKRMLDEALALAGPAPDARVVYVTCSLLPEENEEVVEAVLAGHPDWRLADYRTLLEAGGLPDIGNSAALLPECLQLTPARHGTDGLFVAVLVRKPLEGGEQGAQDAQGSQEGDEAS